MNKLLDFGKKAVFFVRVISGYEERSIRTFRLKLQKKIQEFTVAISMDDYIGKASWLSPSSYLCSLTSTISILMTNATDAGAKPIRYANEKKASIRKIPEQVILSEVRRMVEEMQALNKKLEETETAIEDFLKPTDNQAKLIMNMQLAGDESRMKAMQEQALMENDAAIAAAKEMLTAQASIADAAGVVAAKEKLTI